MRLVTRAIITFTLILFIAISLAAESNQPLRKETSREETSPILFKEKAIWVQSIFFRGHHPTTQEALTYQHLLRLTEKLKQSGIKYAYFFAGPYQPDGTLPEFSFSDTAKRSVQEVKRLYPELKILPWVGGLQDKTVFLEKPEWVERAVKESKRLIDYLEVPGIHIDLEYISATSDYVLGVTGLTGKRLPPDQYYNLNAKFMKALRQGIPDAFISAVYPSSAAAVSQWKEKPRADQIKALSEDSDQVSFLMFDTSVKDKETFETALYQQLNDIQKTRNSIKTKMPQFLVSFGSFINEEQLHKYRHLDVENLPNSFDTLRRVISTRFDNHSPVDGFSIFCEWESDDAEWAEMSRQ